jgi:hypothetical protein
LFGERIPEGEMIGDAVKALGSLATALYLLRVADLE